MILWKKNSRELHTGIVRLSVLFVLHGCDLDEVFIVHLVGHSLACIDYTHKYEVSSRPVLTSFVSSHKCDVYRLHARDDPIAPGLPFACAFTGGKNSHCNAR